MAQRIEVIFRRSASEDIANISYYITTKGYPENAKRFVDKLHKFGESLGIFPEKYTICRHKQFARKNFHCAVFDKNYVFVYKIETARIVIYNVIHTKRLT
ncbi:MAG: type II toxin-antitoxin system RelE/ParE family toxin [Bacteroidales bacterium]|nr:type II toxin-antitoxin system RelE/ParE family toxin [Bacteroidales bacterium]